jgi:hypothetical protein
MRSSSQIASSSRRPAWPVGVTPVLEPTSGGLMLAGLMALSGVRRVRRQAA